MSHVVLLGDSVFDNGAYVPGGPDVVTQLQERLPPDWRASLRAIDGSVTSDVEKQLARLPDDATHLVVSCGGNDALSYADILGEKADSAAEVLLKLAGIGEQFCESYRRMLRAVIEKGLPTTICTIYYPRFPDQNLQMLAVAALAVFNDCIIREAFSAGVPLIDLRLVCSDDRDYANEIEPSVAGGEKIAGAIVRAVTEHDFGRRRTEAFG